MSLSDSLKLTGRITLLLLLVTLPVQVFTIDWNGRIELPEDTQAHIQQLYANPYLHKLINDLEYQELYLTVVFRHFREDIERKGIGGWSRSHWPMILQALDLLPGYYRVVGSQDKFKLRSFWRTWRQNIPAEPILHYGQTGVRIPRILTSVFIRDVPNLGHDTRTVPYQYLVRQMDGFAVRYTNIRRVDYRKKNSSKLLSFKAIYWLTVIDQFIGTVQHMNRSDGAAPPRCPFARTELVPIRNRIQVPQQAGSRVDPVAAPVAVWRPWQTGQMAAGQMAAGPRLAGTRAKPQAYPQHLDPRDPPPAYPLAQPGPSRFNPARRALSAAAGAQSRGSKRKASQQGGGPFQGGSKRGPGGAMRSMDGASNESQVGLQAQQSNSGSSSTALPLITFIMVTIAVSHFSRA